MKWTKPDEGGYEEIERRANEATPGPWVLARHYDAGHCIATMRGPNTLTVEACGDHETWLRPMEDGAFLACSRTDVPALVAEVRRLREAAKG